jgi:hypothetical protein
MNLRLLMGGTLLTLLLGCSGGSNTTFNGTVRGHQLTPADAVSGTGSLNVPPAVSINAAVVVISNTGGLCANASVGKQASNSQFFVITLFDRIGTQTAIPTAPGTYSVTSTTKSASASYLETDATCRSIAGFSALATSGTVTLTSVTSNGLVGTFDLTLNSGDRVTGSFNAPNCGGLISFLNLTTATCI